MTTAAAGTTATSWWYGQGRAVECTRRLESMSRLPAPPGPAGVVSVGREHLTVTFVDGLTSPLPPPWEPAGREARLALSDVDPGVAPDPSHPVYLVVFGATGDTLLALNLAAFGRIRISGDPTLTRALASRWVLELLAAHPDTTVGVSTDVWPGPHTTRLRPVAAGQVPDVDVLVLGTQLSYADRAQIVSVARAPILLDLGADAAVSANWVITCGPDRAGALANTARAASTPLTATLIIPTPDTIDLCADMVLRPPPGADQTPGVVAADWPAEDEDDSADVADWDDDPGAATTSDAVAVSEPVVVPQEPAAVTGHDQQPPSAPGPPISTSPPDPAPAAEVPEAAPTADQGSTPAEQVAVAVIWNRVLGQIEMTPPHGGPAVPDREKRLNELLVYLQWRPWANASEIITDIYGAASDKTLQQQMSLLRGRLGVIRPGGPKALPPLRDGRYTPDPVVRSDWQEFERLVEILVETTPTDRLMAAMDLVTGRPLGGIGAKEWAWAAGLRDEITTRVPQAAVVLAERLHAAGRFADAADIARKGLWFDTARQDVWRIAMMAALDGRDRDGFRTLRNQYLAEIPADARDSEVFELTKRGS